MNTDVTALVEYARRSHDNAERTANAALRMEQTAGRMEREIVEVRRDVRQLTEVVGVLTTPPKPRKPGKFSPTDTGSHFLVPAQDLDALLAQERLREDAATYRSVKRRARQLIVAAAVGSATFGGEHLVKWLLHW